MPPTSPKKLGRYEIASEIGRGMMGIVYEAVDPVLGRRVALKTIQVAFAISAEERDVFEKRFLSEARLAASLQHPNIVVVHDVGWDEESGTPWIAFELLKGRSLSELTPPPLEWREAVRIGARLADALDHAHAAGIVHRDVKPGNVMVLPNGEPKVMDFGIARAPTSQLTAAGEFFGTPSYMSPEQAAGDTLDGRSDIFSLGAVLYLMLTGERAFEAKSVPGILAKVEREDPAPPSTRVAGLPTSLDAIIARALAKRPGDRYTSARQLAEDLDDVLEERAPRNAAALPAVEPTSWNNEPTLHVKPKTLPPPGGGTATLGLPGERPGGWLALPLAALLVVALALALRLPTGDPVASPEPSGAGPGSTTPAATLASGPSRPGGSAPGGAGAGSPEAVATPEPTPTPTPKPTPVPARLTLDVEHGAKAGEIRVYVDKRLVLRKELESEETRRALVFKGRKGKLFEVVDVPPGEHIVRVEVDEPGEPPRAAQILGGLESGAARLLEVRVGNQIALEWK